jgi:hypothetical protein
MAPADDAEIEQGPDAQADQAAGHEAVDEARVDQVRKVEGLAAQAQEADAVGDGQAHGEQDGGDQGGPGGRRLLQLAAVDRDAISDSWLKTFPPVAVESWLPIHRT